MSEYSTSHPSDQALAEATGRDWAAWLAALDAAGAAELRHRDIVAHLEREHADSVSSWWRQTIAVGYERARGLRVVGQTAGAGFQVGVQRRVDGSPQAAWDLLVARPDLWLGAGARLPLEVGAAYGSEDADGTVRVVKPGRRLRMTWQPRALPAPATLQLTILGTASGRTAIHAHLEKLPDAAAREAMRSHWRDVLERFAHAAATAAS